MTNICIIFLLLHDKVIIHCITHNYYTLTFVLHPSLQNSFTHMSTIVRIVVQYLIVSISFHSKVHTTETVLWFYNRTVKQEMLASYVLVTPYRSSVVTVQNGNPVLSDYWLSFHKCAIKLQPREHVGLGWMSAMSPALASIMVSGTCAEHHICFSWISLSNIWRRNRRQRHHATSLKV